MPPQDELDSKYTQTSFETRSRVDDVLSTHDANDTPSARSSKYEQAKRRNRPANDVPDRLRADGKRA
ncbi:hypothetical protein [Corallococcus terminator]|uniref:Uncharacterized protein n=1 Tax=Corallococcus terminator TaxID=2316733 RepID=A0A3A8HAS5_9BACT|nr:hypothetical protein [Corallococcus terminator]RKG64684.1 hypothetical protein D7V88_42020 [Corallococcus terminator]